MITLIAKSNPVSSEIVRCDLAAGLSIKEMLGECYPTVVVFLNGEPVDHDVWGTTYPIDGDLVAAVNVPHGPAKIPALIAMAQAVASAAAAAASAVGAAVGAIGGVMGTTVIGAITVGDIVVAGLMAAVSLLPSLLKPQAQSSGSVGSSGSRYPDLTGGSNQPARFEVFPKLYGTYRIVPPLATTYITASDGPDQFLLFTLCLGYGPMSIDGNPVGKNPLTGALYQTITHNTVLTPGTILLGNTDLGEFTGVRFVIGHWSQIEASFSSQKQLRPLQRDVYQDNLSMTMNHHHDGGEGGWFTGAFQDWHVVSTVEGAVSASLELTFQSLLTVGADGKEEEAAVRWKVQVSPANAGTWTTLYFDGQPYYETRAKTRLPLHYNIGIDFDTPGKYDIKVTRLETLIIDENLIQVDATLSALRSEKPNPPWRVTGYNGGDNVVLMAVRVKDSGQLNGNIDAISILASAMLPVFDTVSRTWSYQVTRSPAWAYADALKGPQVQYPVSDSQLDVDELADWAGWCETTGLTYNWYHTGEETLLERIRALASTGRAAWNMVDGRFSVIREFKGPEAPYLDSFQPVQMFTPRNSRNFQMEKRFIKLPHALRVQYTDERVWSQNEAIVYASGYNEDGSDGKAAATRYEILETQGITSMAQAKLEGAYYMNATRLRPETYTLETDFENLVATRGDCVRIAHDSLLVGLSYGRIKSVTLDGEGLATALELDEEVEMVYDLYEAMPFGDSPPVDYAIRVRVADAGSYAGVGSVLAYPVNPTTAENPSVRTKAVTLQSPTDGLHAGDLFTFGLKNRETLLAKVTQIDYRPDFSATLTLVPAAIELALENPDHAVFDPIINLPPESLNPLPPHIASITGTGNTVSIGPDGTPLTEVWVAWVLPVTTTRPIPVDRIELYYYAEDVADVENPKPLGPVLTQQVSGAVLTARLPNIPRPTHTESGAVVPDPARLAVRIRCRSIYGRWSSYSTTAYFDLAANTMLPPNSPKPIRGGNIPHWMEPEVIDADVYVKNLSVTNAKIQNAAVDTLKIQGYSITVPRYASGETAWEGLESESAPFESAPVCSVTIPAVAAGVRGSISIMVTGVVHNNAGTARDYTLRFYCDGVLLPTPALTTSVKAKGYETVVGLYLDSPDENAHTYDVRVLLKTGKRIKSRAHLHMLTHEARR
jgi:hypothetical protein